MFFALWPDERVAGALALAARAAAETCAGRQMRKDTLHMTLAFIGGVTDARLVELQTIAAAVRAPAFSMTLNELACWRHNRIVWAGAAIVPPALAGLTGDLNAALRRAGYRLDERPFAAHVTLIRKASCRGALTLQAPISWPVGDYVLAESLLRPDGASYRPLARFGLDR